MEKIWTAYDNDAKKSGNLTEPELITLANGQKAVVGKSEETVKTLYRSVSSEYAKALAEE